MFLNLLTHRFQKNLYPNCHCINSRCHASPHQLCPRAKIKESMVKCAESRKLNNFSNGNLLEIPKKLSFKFPMLKSQLWAWPGGVSQWYWDCKGYTGPQLQLDHFRKMIKAATPIYCVLATVIMASLAVLNPCTVLPHWVREYNSLRLGAPPAPLYLVNIEAQIKYYLFCVSFLGLFPDINHCLFLWDPIVLLVLVSGCISVDRLWTPWEWQLSFISITSRSIRRRCSVY